MDWNSAVHGTLEDTWRQGFGDSSTVRTEELDALLASILQEVEDRRADQLQQMVAEVLQEQEQKKEEKEGEKEKD